MKFLIFLFFVFSLTLALDFTTEGLTKIKHVLETPKTFNDANNRILNGFPVNSDTRFPFVTDNVITWPDQGVSGCSGAMLSASWIITARQCMFCDDCNWAAQSVAIHVGSASRASPRQMRWIAHAEWINSASGANPDLALMWTSTPIQITPTASPIHLPSFPQSFDFFENRHSVILGWGAAEATTQTMRLHYGDVTITDRRSCNQTFIPTMNNYEFCARSSPMFPVELSEGDQGGPMIIVEGADWNIFTIIGVLSTARKSTADPTPIIMGLRVGQFWQYIHEVTGIPPIW